MTKEEQEALEIKIAEIENRFGDLSDSISQKIDNLTISFGKTLEVLDDLKRRPQKEPPPPPPKAYEEASHAVDLLRSISKITKEISDSNTAAIMQGLKVGVDLGRVESQAQEAESRLEDQEDEIDELTKVLKEAKKNGNSDEIDSLLKQILEKFSAGTK